MALVRITLELLLHEHRKAVDVIGSGKLTHPAP
jgi:hypothetical protein